MTWAEFLTTIENQNHHQLSLVGPCLTQPHPPFQPTIYIDGGADFKSTSPQDPFPFVSVGDGDSSRAHLDEILPQHKDYSDLAFVLRGLSPSVRHLDLFGFLGGRRDHEIANFGEVRRFLKRASTSLVTAHFFDQNRRALVAFAGGTVELELRGTFSVIVFEEASVRIEGQCDYPLDGTKKLGVASSHGLSNVGHGFVRITCSEPCFVYLP